VLALLYLTLALVLTGALALRAVTQQSFYSAVWETIAGACPWTLQTTFDICNVVRCSSAMLVTSEQHRHVSGPPVHEVNSVVHAICIGVGIDWTFASLDEAAAHTVYGFAGRAVAVAVSLGGVCITALLLGIVSEQISHWIEDLKRGRSEVGVHSVNLLNNIVCMDRSRIMCSIAILQDATLCQ
jgi:hypothetical protein